MLCFQAINEGYHEAYHVISHPSPDPLRACGRVNDDDLSSQGSHKSRTNWKDHNADNERIVYSLRNTGIKNKPNERASNRRESWYNVDARNEVLSLTRERQRNTK
mgnify:CR=1 FL=1